MDAGFHGGIRTGEIGGVCRKWPLARNWAILTRWTVNTSRGRNEGDYLSGLYRTMGGDDIRGNWVCRVCS